MDAHTHTTAAPATSSPAWHLMLKMLSLVAAIVIAAVVATFLLVPSSASSGTVGDACAADGTSVAGGRGGSIVTPEASFEIIGSSLAESTNSELCGTLTATQFDPRSESRPTNSAFEISAEVLADHPQPALQVQMDGPLAGSAAGTVVGRANGDRLALDGVLLDVESGEVAAAIEGWQVVPGALPVDGQAPFTITS